MRDQKTLIAFKAPVEMDVNLRMAAAMERRSKSDVIRQALREWLERRNGQGSQQEAQDGRL